MNHLSRLTALATLMLAAMYLRDHNVSVLSSALSILEKSQSLPVILPSEMDIILSADPHTNPAII